MLLGSSGSLEGIGDVIAKFYGGERKKLEPVRQGEVTEWTVHQTNGAQISSVRVVLQRGRYRFEKVK